MLKNRKLSNNVGLTLLEAMLALSLLAYASLGKLNETVNDIKETESKIFGQDLAKMVYAVDRRLSVDGIEAADWDTSAWANDNAVVNDLFARQLVGFDNPGCGMGTGWSPTEVSAQKVALVPCNFYSAKSFPYDLNVSAGIESASTDVDVFFFNFSFASDADFEEHFRGLLKAVTTARSVDAPGLKGAHNYQFVNSTTLVPYPTTVDCFNDRSNCMLRVTMETGAGASGDYLKVDGSNEMEAGVNFRNGGGIQQCTAWKGTSGAVSSWSLSVAADNFSCGIIGGMGTTDVQVVANQITGEEIVLDQLCTVKRKGTAGANANRLENLATTVPCGMTQDGGIVSLASDNFIANNAYITEVVTNSVITRGIDSYGDIEVRVDNAAGTRTILMESATGNVSANGYVAAENYVQGGAASSATYGQVRLLRFGLRGYTTGAGSNNGSLYLQPAAGKDLRITGFGGVADQFVVDAFNSKYEKYRASQDIYLENANSRFRVRAGYGTSGAGANNSLVEIFASSQGGADDGTVDIRASSENGGDRGEISMNASSGANGDDGLINLRSSAAGSRGQINLTASSNQGEINLNASEVTVTGNLLAQTSTMGVTKDHTFWDRTTPLPVGYGQMSKGDRRRYVTKDYVDSSIRLIDLVIVSHDQDVPKPSSTIGTFGSATGCEGTNPLIVLTPISMYTYSYDDSGKVNDCRSNTAAANYGIEYSFENSQFMRVNFGNGRNDTLGSMSGRGFYPARLVSPACDKVKNDLVYSQYAISVPGAWRVKMFLTGWGGRTKFGGKSVAHVYCDKIRNHP